MFEHSISFSIHDFINLQPFSEIINLFFRASNRRITDFLLLTGFPMCLMNKMSAILILRRQFQETTVSMAWYHQSMIRYAMNRPSLSKKPPMPKSRGGFKIYSEHHGALYRKEVILRALLIQFLEKGIDGIKNRPVPVFDGFLDFFHFGL